ncbi:MAG: aminoglycoside phosphotransferase family protein [Actinobacteria bacterium]|nr:aminoglycoside phosphotransferase family protein [Actinomycetota bacterium]
MSDPTPLAAAAARQWGLPDPVLIRTGMNSLFAAGDDVVLRVGRPAFPIATERAWMSLMSSHDVRVPRLLHDMNGGEGVSVVAIERIHPVGDIDWCATGAMVHRLHAIDPSAAPGLPWAGHFPHWQIESLLADVRASIDSSALAGIERCLRQWAGWQERLREHLVVCHGDVHPGNVMQAADGPVLIDWDLRCMAPAGWDHGPMLQWSEHWTTRWGGGPLAYDQFAQGYGVSLRDDWMTQALSAMRMVIATLMRVRAGRTDVVAAAEAERRLRYWRGDPDAPLWDPQ